MRWVQFQKREQTAEGDRTIWVDADRVLAIVGGKSSGATLYLDGHDALIGVTATADEARALLTPFPSVDAAPKSNRRETDG